MKKAVEIVVIIVFVLATIYACNYAWDNDSNFQLSPVYEGTR